MINTHEREIKDEQDKVERIRIQSQAMEIQHSGMTESLIVKELKY